MPGRSWKHRVTRILKAVDIPDNDKKEIKKELISNYTDASIMNAQARGAQTVGRADVEFALVTAEPPEEIASMYMVSYTETLVAGRDIYPVCRVYRGLCRSPRSAASSLRRNSSSSGRSPEGRRHSRP